jgi:DNA repair exonuclease SbcCD ATPase subunit
VMGKKSKTAAKAAPAPPAAPVPAVSQPAAPTTTSSSASANSYQNLIRALVSIPEGDSEERTEIIEKLAAEYKSLASTNLVNKQKERAITGELALTDPQFTEISETAARVKAEHDTVSTKYNKLRQLSLQLSERTKQADARTASLLYEEQQKRVKLTENFSASIATISTKLETLASRRESVVKENIELKALLRSYLAEFDALEGKTAEQNEKSGPANTTVTDGDNSDSAAPAQDEVDQAADSTEKMADTTDTTAVDNDASAETTPPEPAAEPVGATNDSTTAEPLAEAATAVDTTASEETERATMQYQDDLARLTALRQREQQLRAQSARYAALFETFQTQLAQCNDAFTKKQASIEALSKEMQQLEKDNAAMAKKSADVVLSTKVRSFQYYVWYLVVCGPNLRCLRLFCFCGLTL